MTIVLERTRTSTHRAAGHLDGTWAEDARRAMVENPDYFVWWYSIKSLALVAALAAAAYYAGKATRTPYPMARGTVRSRVRARALARR